MGTWASYVVSREEEGRPREDASRLVEAAREGWAWWELPPMAAELLALLAGEGPAVLASVADSDVCVVSGWFDGQMRWRWVYSNVWTGDGVSEQLEADLVNRTRDAVTGIADWADAAELRAVDHDDLEEALEAGDVFAEESLLRLLVLLGVAAPDSDQPDGKPLPVQPTAECPAAWSSESWSEVKAVAIDHSSSRWRQLLLDHDLYEFGEPPAMVCYEGMVFLASDPPVAAIGPYYLPLDQLGPGIGASGPWIEIPAPHAADLVAAAAWARVHVGHAGAPPWPSRPRLNIEVGSRPLTARPADLTAHLYSVAPQVSYRMELTTYLDLRARWDVLASWLDQVRHTFLEPIVDAYAERGGVVEYGWDGPPGTPYCLGIWSVFRTSTGQGGTATADTASWSRLLARVGRGEIHDVSLEARVMNGDGAWGDRWGSFAVRVRIRPGGPDSATLISLVVSEPMLNLIGGEQQVASLEVARIGAACR